MPSKISLSFLLLFLLFVPIVAIIVVVNTNVFRFWLAEGAVVVVVDLMELELVISPLDTHRTTTHTEVVSLFAKRYSVDRQTCRLLLLTTTTATAAGTTYNNNDSFVDKLWLYFLYIYIVYSFYNRPAVQRFSCHAYRSVKFCNVFFSCPFIYNFWRHFKIVSHILITGLLDKYALHTHHIYL